MVQATTNIHVEGPGLFDRIANFLADIAGNNRRVRMVEFLNSLSDDELAARGIRRDRIVQHVFADVMHI